MSTSLLYHGFGVRDYRYVRTEYIPGGVVFTIERRAETCRCAACGSENVWREGMVVRRFRTVTIGAALPSTSITNTSSQRLVSLVAVEREDALRAFSLSKLAMRSFGLPAT